MSNINLPASRVAEALGIRPSRDAVRAVQAVLERGAVGAAHMSVVQDLTTRALHAAADIGETEGRLLGRSPLAESGMQLISATGYAMLAVTVERYGAP